MNGGSVNMVGQDEWRASVHGRSGWMVDHYIRWTKIIGGPAYSMHHYHVCWFPSFRHHQVTKKHGIDYEKRIQLSLLYTKSRQWTFYVISVSGNNLIGNVSLLFQNYQCVKSSCMHSKSEHCFEVVMMWLCLDHWIKTMRPDDWCDYDTINKSYDFI